MSPPRSARSFARLLVGNGREGASERASRPWTNFEGARGGGGGEKGSVRANESMSPLGPLARPLPRSLARGGGWGGGGWRGKHGQLLKGRGGEKMGGKRASERADVTPRSARPLPRSLARGGGGGRTEGEGEKGKRATERADLGQILKGEGAWPHLCDRSPETASFGIEAPAPGNGWACGCELIPSHKV